MKKFRILAAVLVFTALTLGLAVFAYADTTLKYDKSVFFDNLNQDRGWYPKFDGLGDLNKKIVDDIWKEYETFTQINFTTLSGNLYSDAVASNTAGGPTDTFKITTTISGEGAFAKVVIAFTGDAPYSGKSLTYFVGAGGEIDEAAYEEGIKPAPAEEEPAVEDDGGDVVEPEDEDGEETPDEDVDFPELDENAMVQLSLYVEDLGLVAEWDGETKTVTLVTAADAVVVAKLTIGLDVYINDAEEEISLGVAPEIQNNRTFVPVSFFTKILGATAELAEGDGSVVIRWAGELDEEDAVEADEVAEEAVEAEETAE